MAEGGVPAVPAWLEASPDPDMSAFLAIWSRVLAWESAAGTVPRTAATILAPNNSALQMMTPCDVGDPFMEDEILQKTLVLRHVLTETVQPPDGAAEICCTSLEGKTVKVRAGPTFTGEGGMALSGKPLGDGKGSLLVYLVDGIYVNCEDVSAAIGRHPQTNPFESPEPEPELR